MLSEKQQQKLILERDKLNNNLKTLKNFIQTARDNGSPESQVLWKQLEKELWTQHHISLKPSKLLQKIRKTKRVWD